MTYAARAKTSGSIYKTGALWPEGGSEHAPPRRLNSTFTLPVSSQSNHQELEFFWGTTAGAHTPQIDHQVTRGGNNGAFAGTPRQRTRFDQRWVLLLPLEHPPRRFDQQVSDLRIAVFGHTALAAALVAAVFARAQSGVAAGLTPVVEPTPIAHLTGEDRMGQCAQSLRPCLPSTERFDPRGQRFDFGLELHRVALPPLQVLP